MSLLPRPPRPPKPSKPVQPTGAAQVSPGPRRRPLDLPRPVGFVLGGGASLGAVQIGMLRALRERGIEPDMITGTSVGALNGAIYAADPGSGLDRLTEMWLQLHRADVFPGNPMSLVWRLGRSRTHAVKSTALHRLLADALDADTFADLGLPLAVVAVDLATGHGWVIDSGPLVPAVLASAAIPGVYPSVTVGGRSLVDGGVVANVPVRQGWDQGARSLVVLDTTVPAPRSPGEPRFRDVLARVNQVQLRGQLLAALPDVAAEIPVVFLPPPAPHRVSPLDFSHTAALMDDSYARSLRFLRQLTVDGPGIYGDPYTRYVAGESNVTAGALASGA